MAMSSSVAHFHFIISGKYRISNIIDLCASIANVCKHGDIALNFRANTVSESNRQHNNSAYFALAHVLGFSGSSRCDTAAHLYGGDGSML